MATPPTNPISPRLLSQMFGKLALNQEGRRKSDQIGFLEGCRAIQETRRIPSAGYPSPVTESSHLITTEKAFQPRSPAVRQPPFASTQEIRDFAVFARASTD